MSSHKSQRPTRAEVRKAVRSLKALRDLHSPWWDDADAALLARLERELATPARGRKHATK